MPGNNPPPLSRRREAARFGVERSRTARRLSATAKRGRGSEIPRRAFLAGAGAWFAAGCRTNADALTVYCAHDTLHAAPILDRFAAETGVPLAVKYDTEATKSLGLVNLLIREERSPRCDVFWNNQVLGTEELRDRGLLAPYRGSGWDRIPDPHRDAEGYWVGFGARLRVLIENTDRLPEPGPDDPAAEPSSFALARPLFGTTLTHYAVLRRELGDAGLRAFHDSLVAGGATFAAGNAAVKDLVAGGRAAAGWTDTDDASLALEAGKPVRITPAWEHDRVIAIPNTAAIVRGTRHRAAAERLVDFLAGAAVEVALANAPSRQIPLGDVGDATLPDAVREWRELIGESVPLTGLLEHRRAVVAWLTGSS